MEGHGADAARALAREAGERLAAAPGGPFAFSCGVAVLDAEHRHSGDLFRAADAAQYAAKRVGGGSVFVAEPGHAEPAVEPASRRRFRDARPDDRAALVRDLLAQLDGPLAAASAARSGSRPSPSASPSRSTPPSGRSRDRAPGAATVATTRSAERRGVRIRRPGRVLRARRLPADGGRARARRRLRRSRRTTPPPTRASARCSTAGASPPSPRPRRSGRDGAGRLRRAVRRPPHPPRG